MMDAPEIKKYFNNTYCQLDAIQVVKRRNSVELCRNKEIIPNQAQFRMQLADIRTEAKKVVEAINWILTESNDDD